LLQGSSTVQDALASDAVYIVRRDVAKSLVIPLTVVPGDEAADLGLNGWLPRSLGHNRRQWQTGHSAGFSDRESA